MFPHGWERAEVSSVSKREKSSVRADEPVTSTISRGRDSDHVANGDSFVRGIGVGTQNASFIWVMQKSRTSLAGLGRSERPPMEGRRDASSTAGVEGGDQG